MIEQNFQTRGYKGYPATALPTSNSPLLPMRNQAPTPIICTAGLCVKAPYKGTNGGAKLRARLKPKA
eukprot:3653423-Amphidinium_carterae.2